MRKLRNSELNRLSVEEFKESDKNPIVVIMDNVRSCNNIGSLFRTSDGLLVNEIYLCGISATPPHRDIHKTALGAELSMAWQYFEKTEDAVTQLKKDGFTVYAVEQVEGSISLPDFTPKPSEKIALIFGNEVKGVQQEVVHLCDNAIEIPQFGTKHSFNIAVSAAIVLWDITTKLMKR